ncbi:MAG: sulfatase-like hydrolase/transferase [Planctomycetota bacterium]|nr:sulfatase-like hydrolase/transferase [Planctomycetota bacterium]
MASSRPNILVIMSDEHDRAVAGCYGDPLVRTPHLDALAASGIAFDAAYTTSPLCVPGRLSFTACQYVSRFGGWNNGSRLPSDRYPSLPRALNAAGYDCLLGGKMHYDGRHRYGFRDLVPHAFNNDTMTGKGVWRSPGDTKVAEKSWNARAKDFHAGDDSLILRHDREVTATCSRFLAERGADEKPFFLLAGYLAPHFPLVVPEPYAGRYAGKVPAPDLPPGLLENLPRNYKHLRRGFGVETAEMSVQRRGRDLYWGLVEWFDHEVGKLLAALRGNPAIAENTVVVYTSDHGENKGDHGLWWKNNMYEHSAGVPLIVSWPGRWAGGQRRTGACSFMDLVQTIAAWGGAQAHEAWDGDSLGAYLDDPAHPWKDFALSEYYGHNICSGITMVRQGAFKYVYHNAAGAGFPAERELYDLAADPREFKNLAADPAHRATLERLHARMLGELGEDPEAINARCIEQCAKGYAEA